VLHVLIGERRAPMTERGRRVYETLDRYRRGLKPHLAASDPDCAFYAQCDVWAKALYWAYDELEQSAYLAEHFRRRVRIAVPIESMTGEQFDDYRRYEYFYKNAFIRVFSLLDKLGSFLNGLFHLRTDRVKRRYSYFTVLRQMQYVRAVPELARQLVEAKERHAEPMQRLRMRRNVEIHLLNAEMQDDLLAAAAACVGPRTYVEDLEANAQDLEEGLEMVSATLESVFRFLAERLRDGSHPSGPIDARDWRFRQTGAGF